MNFLHFDGENVRLKSYTWGRLDLAVDHLVVSLKHRLNMNQQCETADKNANATLWYINRNTEARLHEAIAPFASALVIPL